MMYVNNMPKIEMRKKEKTGYRRAIVTLEKVQANLNRSGVYTSSKNKS